MQHPSFREYIAQYANNSQHNDRLHQEFTHHTNEIPILRSHRDFIKNRSLGFGEPAFHFMWYEIMRDFKERGISPALLEIGIYKGQVISLWALLAREFSMNVNIVGIGPLQGNISSNPLVNNFFVNKLRSFFQPGFRKIYKEGSLYPKVNYEKTIRKLFEAFNLEVDQVKLYKGLSGDSAIQEAVRQLDFDLVYIDGDHSYEIVKKDILDYSTPLRKGGLLVMDDASSFLEGTVFWKGHQDVSKAVEIVEDLGFRNVLNIGHNRIYEKL